MNKNVAVLAALGAAAVLISIEPALAETAADIAEPLQQKTDEVIEVAITWGQRLAVGAAVVAFLLCMTGRIRWSWFGGIFVGAIGLTMADALIGWLSTAAN